MTPSSVAPTRLSQRLGVGEPRRRRRQPESFATAAITPEECFQRAPPLCQDFAGQIAAVGIDQEIEGDEDGRRLRRRAFALGSPPGGRAATTHRTKSRGRPERRSRRRARIFSAPAPATPRPLPGNTASSSRPDFDCSSTLSPSRKASVRNPSHFGSYCHSGPTGNRLDRQRLHRAQTAFAMATSCKALGEA